MGKYKTVEDIELVMFANEKFDGLSLRSMRGEKAMSIFKEVYFLHLLNINGKNGKKILFNEDFKNFVVEEIGVSMRTVNGWMNKLVRTERISKVDGYYIFSDNMRKIFRTVKIK